MDLGYCRPSVRAEGDRLVLCTYDAPGMGWEKPSTISPTVAEIAIAAIYDKCDQAGRAAITGRYSTGSVEYNQGFTAEWERHRDELLKYC